MSTVEVTKISHQPAKVNLNADYVEELYQRWLESPETLADSWRYFFQGFELAMCPRNCVAGDRAAQQSAVAGLIYAYRSQGHLVANLDPLGNNLEELPALHLEEFGFSESDLEEVFDTGHLAGPKRANLREIIQILKDTYCRSIGVEYIHIQDREIRRWLQQEMEPVRNRPGFDPALKLAILEKLVHAEVFESFLQSRYPGQKRFSLEGAETMIAAINELVELAPVLGVEEIVIGMSHRGRLNMLTNVLEKSHSMIFEEFEGYIPEDSFGTGGDVKYHVGFSSDFTTRLGKKIHLTLTSNPSHLEAVDPVVQGRARAKQRQRNDTAERRKVLPLLLHGEAAFSGQGLVAEVFNLSQLEGYHTGGTIHFIVNNQIGFTTDPEDARSTGYATDIAKMVEAPIFHVNGDDPEAVVFVTGLALRFRQEFHRDAVIDMVCYRRFGHNEGDEPAFTQPLMYRKIRKHPPVRKIYAEQLVREKVLPEGDAERSADEYREKLRREFEQAHEAEVKTEVKNQYRAFEAQWEGLRPDYSPEPVDTSVSREMLVEAAKALTTIPDGFNLNRKIARHLPGRMESIEQGGEIDWGFAESLAFGTLLAEGTPVRLSGQDSRRGTFSHRHSYWYDTETMAEYVPLSHISADQARFCAYNSPLAEASVLGFDYGYSLSEPNMLIVWEAQFGDFTNGAQVIIDQFLTSSQAKWQRTSGLVMLLPHGYEGMGPEHSNAYLERYLAACAQQNIQVCNLTTPAQLFHALRRQVKRNFRRPLIVMSPKSLLRHKRCTSPVEDFISGRFREILDDPQPPKKPKRLVICCGKLYYDLLEKRESDGVEDVALVRIEQLYPLNNDLMQKIAGRYKQVGEIVWAQEEPKNRGAWTFIRPWLQYLFPEEQIRYIGRGWAASPATGSFVKHREEQEKIVEEVIHGEFAPNDIAVLPEGVEKR